MSEHFDVATSASRSDTERNCWTWLNTLQIVLGLLLLLASAFGYPLFKHPVVLVPAVMGAFLLFFGAKAAFVCRGRLMLHDHHPTNGTLG